jgi:hypothetical protein
MLSQTNRNLGKPFANMQGLYDRCLGRIWGNCHVAWPLIREGDGCVIHDVKISRRIATTHQAEADSLHRNDVRRGRWFTHVTNGVQRCWTIAPPESVQRWRGLKSGPTPSHEAAAGSGANRVSRVAGAT